MAKTRLRCWTITSRWSGPCANGMQSPGRQTQFLRLLLVATSPYKIREAPSMSRNQQCQHRSSATLLPYAHFDGTREIRIGPPKQPQVVFCWRPLA